MEKLGINTKILKNWQIERLEVFKKILNKIVDIRQQICYTIIKIKEGPIKSAR